MSHPEPTPDLEQLLATWQVWNSRDVLARTAHRAARSGDAQRAATLHALLPARGVELADRRRGPRAGPTWDDVAATGTTTEQARTDHVQQLERARAAATAADLEFDHHRDRREATHDTAPYPTPPSTRSHP